MSNVVQPAPPRRLALTASSLYADTIEQLLAEETAGIHRGLRGSFKQRAISGKSYWYYQYRDLDQAVRQIYCGPVGGPWDRVVARASEPPEATDVRERAALLRAAGFPTVPAASFRLLAALADAGIFRAGGVLVGTYGFMALGNQLGVVWRGLAAVTQDVDIGHARGVELAVPGVEMDLPQVLEGLEIGFHPVPKLDPRQPSTSFIFRNQALRLDLITPMRAGRSAPVKIKALGAAAQPLKFLDYLLETPCPALLVGRRALRIAVPEPARFAVHKLLVASARPAAQAVKAQKDRQQAVDLLAVLCDERPGDVAFAWREAVIRGRNWSRRLRSELSRIDAETKTMISDTVEGP